MVNSLKIGLFAVAASLIASLAHAGPCQIGNPSNNCPPPVGNVVFDGIDNQPVPHSYTAYTTLQFTVTETTTDLTFAFRDDPSFLSSTM
jgi:hypothetical protein